MLDLEVCKPIVLRMIEQLVYLTKFPRGKGVQFRISLIGYPLLFPVHAVSTLL